jgi:hypothetical protein
MEQSQKKLKSRASFTSKESIAHINKSGHFQRPINRIVSNEELDPGMTDKLYNLMANYIPKDINSIQTRFAFNYLASSITFSIPWPELVSTSKRSIAI